MTGLKDQFKTKMLTFGDRVRRIVKSIPKGQVMTYGEVAKTAGSPGASRAVGNIMSRNDDKFVPCHRVIAAGGKLGGYNGLKGEKERLLKMEGARWKIKKV